MACLVHLQKKSVIHLTPPISVVNTNLRGTFFLTQSVFKQCMKENGGSIVNILMELHGGWPGFAHSVSARAGVEALAKTLAVEWG